MPPFFLSLSLFLLHCVEDAFPYISSSPLEERNDVRRYTLLPSPLGERDRVRGSLKLFLKIKISFMKRQNIEKCRKMRRDQTDAERKLWALLRNRQFAGAKFRRQFSIGKYILDFYCPTCKIGIEADGGQHYEPIGEEKDNQRTNELSLLGITMLRFSNNDILQNIEGVWEIVQKERSERQKPPSPQPSSAKAADGHALSP